MAFITKFMAEVIVVADLFCKNSSERKREEERGGSGCVPQVIRFFHRTVSISLFSFSLQSPLPPLFLSHAPHASSIFSLFSYSTRQIIPQGILFPASVQSCGSEEGEEATLSHLESNRGPLSKKLISLNIILGASGSRRALTNPSVHP